MRWLPLALVALLVVGLLVWQEPGALGLGSGGGDPALAVAPAERIGPCRVRSVVDGDTLDVECPTPERVRLLRIDTPERDEPGFAEARAALREQLRGRRVELVLERPAEPVRDRYGRLLAYLYLGERNLNVEMVRSGRARFDARFGAGRFGHVFAAAEAEAQAAARGLHAAP